MGSMSKEEIYKTIIGDIVCLRYRPGDLLKEAELSARFNLSRTPLREVLKRLALEGYVTVVPRHGNKVSYIDVGKVRQIVDMRVLLETAVEKQLVFCITDKESALLQQNLDAQRAAIDECDNEKFWQLDNSFHESMFIFAGKSVWWETIKMYEAHYMRFRKLEMTDNTNYELLYVHHKNILKNIIDRNIGEIELSVREHVAFCLQRMPVLIDKYPSYFKS